MTNFITGIIGVALIIVFLGQYALTLNSLPLWIIILAILVMVVIDFVQSVGEFANNNPGRQER